MLMPGIRAASLPRAPLPGMEPFSGAGHIFKGFSVHSAPSTPAWAAPGSRLVLWEPMAGAGAAQASAGITPQDAPSDAAQCSGPFRGAGFQRPWGMVSPSFQHCGLGAHTRLCWQRMGSLMPQALVG